MRRLTSNLMITGAVFATTLVGFTGAANASATIDLIWASSGTDTIVNVPVSSEITLQVILTAGPNGSQGAGVSVDYGSAAGLTVLGYMSTEGDALPLLLGSTNDTGTRIQNVNSAALPPYMGAGLTNGQSHQLGTVTFHEGAVGNGTFEIRVDANGPTDGVLDLDGNDISSTVAFNSAYLIRDGTLPTPTAGATPTASPTPTPETTPTATPIPSPTPVPTAPPTWPRQRGDPPPDLSCLCEIENINPNQVVLKNVGTGGRGSETTRTLVMNLTAVDASGANCEPGASSSPALIGLEMVDDDGDVLVDDYEIVACSGGSVTTTVKWDVSFQGPLNCENGAMPPPKPGFSTGTIAITGAAPLRPYYYENTRIKCFE